MKKHLLITVLMSCIVVMLAFSVNATIIRHGSCGENVTWAVDDLGTLTISGNGDMADYSANKAPWYGININNLVVEGSVKKIGNYAFSNMGSIEQVTIKNGVEKIGIAAFYKCGSIIKLTLPDSVNYIGDSAFQSCISLVSINIPYGVERIGATTFDSCITLSSIILPNSIKSIGNSAFAGCKALTTITIPYGVETIPQNCFNNCWNFASIRLPGTITAIASTAFDFSAIKTVYFGGTPDQWNDIANATPSLNSLEVIFETDVIPQPPVITYNANGGMEPPSPETTETGAVTISSEILSRTNYEFLGWAKSSDATAPEFKGGDTVTFSQDTTLYAVWKKTGTFDTQLILTIGDTAANVNGKTMYNDVAPILENSRTMLPARFVAEKLGAKVSWNDAEQKVTIKNDTTTIEIVIGSNTAYVNGEAKTLDVPAFLRNSRTYTPVRFICESLGAKVEWDEAQQRVIVTK